MTASAMPKKAEAPPSPDGIPADLMAIGESIARDIPARAVHRGFAANVIARALMAERERAAEEANGVDPAILEGKSERFVSIYCAARVDAAAAIRGERQ